MALPALEAAQNALNTLNKVHIVSKSIRELIFARFLIENYF